MGIRIMKTVFPRAVRDNCPYLKSIVSRVGVVILNRPWRGLGFSLIVLLLPACQTTPTVTKSALLIPPTPMPAARTDDVIIVDGQTFHTGTRIITWREKEGYNAYNFQPTKLAGDTNYSARRLPSSETEDGWVDRQGPWDLPALQGYVDQFVLHYDSEGFSRRCFEILQLRGLSAHFLLDLDGTIYQTLDLRERAYHATESNSRSIGIEIANAGAFGMEEISKLSQWYQLDEEGHSVLKIPVESGDPKFHQRDYVARPSHDEMVVGKINGRVVRQYDFTPEQYAALIKLTAAIHRVFPLIKLDQPRDAEAQLIREKLTEESLLKYQGLIGHYHIQTNKVDPGPAFDWDKLIDGARQLSESKSVTQ